MAGAALTRERDGSFRYRTRSGLTHLVSPAEQPVCDDPRARELWEGLLEIQPDPAELVEALHALRHHQRVVASTEHHAAQLGQEDQGWWDVPPVVPELSALVS